MTTPTGTIGLSDVNVELAKASTATITLNDAAVRSLAGIASGAIDMNSLRGKSSLRINYRNAASVTTIGSDKYIVFNVVGTAGLIQVIGSGTVRALACGGGGRGGTTGNDRSAGGGAGGVADSNVTVSGGTYTITVGPGLSGTIDAYGNGSVTQGPSSFGSYVQGTAGANGGAGAGNYGCGSTGGSSGIGYVNGGVQYGANAGGTNAGGGGGAGAAGTAGGCTGSGTGGTGRYSDITGTGTYYGGGGTGSACCCVQAGGTGGGGASGGYRGTPGYGTNGLGGGGGGSCAAGANIGKGGSGVVIIRVPGGNVGTF